MANSPLLYRRETILDQEKILVERAKTDKEAFVQLYDRYYSQIFGYALRRTADVEVAQDVTSQVFLKALRNIRRFQWRGVPFSSWLYRIASNEITNSFRERRRRQACLERQSETVDDSDSSPEDELAQAEEELRKHEEFLSVHRNISKLPPVYQEAITLRYFEHKHLKEIGAIMGKSDGVVKSLLHRALRKLRELME